MICLVKLLRHFYTILNFMLQDTQFLRQSFHLVSNSVGLTQTFHQKAGSPVYLWVTNGLINQLNFCSPFTTPESARVGPGILHMYPH